MRAVITVVGKDSVGILAKVSAKCAESDVNINEVTQSVLEDMFCMIMLCDISKSKLSLTDLSKALIELGEKIGVSIHVQHEDIFNAMHNV